MSYQVLKFGGTSVASSKNIKLVENIIQETLRKNSQIIVVVSAFGNLQNEPKITDLLIKMGNLASQKQKLELLESIKIFKNKHINICKELKINQPYLAQVYTIFTELDGLLKFISLKKQIDDRDLDSLMSFGERLSAFIIASYLNSTDWSVELFKKFEFLDTRQLIITDSRFGSALVDFEKTRNLIQKKLINNKDKIFIATGFIAANQNGETTTLGRGGSDYTASIFASLVNAKKIEIWTDVDGVLTADPKKVKTAFSLDSLSYEEAMEVSHFGAKVIYPPTIEPAKEKNIPVLIRNTFNPNFSGTIIGSNVDTKYPFLIKAVTSLKDLSLIQLEGAGLKGKYGISARLFKSLSSQKINVILISQASSEYSICFAIDSKLAHLAKQKIELEFAQEINHNLINPIKIIQQIVIIAVIGSNMKHYPGVSGKVFSALGRVGINVIAIAQGSSELNISFVINPKDEILALKVIHNEFFFDSRYKQLDLYIIGATGQIGKELIKQIKLEQDNLIKNKNIKVNLKGVLDSKKSLFGDNLLELNDLDLQLKKSTVQSKIDYLLKESKSNLNLDKVIVDCTSSEVISNFYTKFIKAGSSIVTANKKLASGKQKDFISVIKLAEQNKQKFLYETNVGAGLPIISTLQDLLKTGDKITKIEAVLSGTLSYIFNTFDETTDFSEVVKIAQKKGYTEPDPRDDLNGLDVARKILILARNLDLNIELEDIDLQSPVNSNLFDSSSIEDFYKRLKHEDSKMKSKCQKIKNKKLRYIASIVKISEPKNYKIKVSLETVDTSHPFYNLTGSENIISFWTYRYSKYPLVIKGPGAGAEVTAAGVFADILKCVN